MSGKSVAVLCAAVLAAIAAANACFSPQYREDVPCSGVHDCPPGRICADDICVPCQSVEICNNAVDDDCDGDVDEDCPCLDGAQVSCELQPCPGQKVCVDGEWSSCEATREPKTEKCDRVMDEDCDGAVDEGGVCNCEFVGSAIQTNCGPCRDGVQRCTASGLGPCEDASPKIDCCSGDTRVCGTATGACSTGIEACTSAGRWSGVCSGTGPMSEMCNGVDDNCDGAIDNIPQCQACLPLGDILVHDMAPPAAGDAEFEGHGPSVNVKTTYFISGGGSRVCARVTVTMQETTWDHSLASRTVQPCSAVAPGTIASVKSDSTTYVYTDDDWSADPITPSPTSGIASIRCVGDTDGPDICNGGSNFTDCSKCELLDVCPFVRYRP